MVQRVKRRERRQRQMESVLRAIGEVFARTAVVLDRVSVKIERLAQALEDRSDA